MSTFTVKRQQPMKSKTFRLPMPLLEQLERTAQKYGVSTNDFVRQCCVYALGCMESEEFDDPDDNR